MDEVKDIKENAGETPEPEKTEKKKKRGKAILISAIAAFAALACAAAALLLFVKPEFTLNGKDGVTCEIFEEYKDEGAVAKYLWFDITDRVTGSSHVDTEKIGEYSVDYSLSFLGKDYSLKRTVTVIDSTPPEITLKDEGEMIVSSFDFYKEPGFTATDNADGDLTEKVATEKKESGDDVTLIYTVSDLSGNTASAERRITVKDIVPPVLKLNGEEKIETGSPTFEDPGAAATDDLDGDITDRIEATSDYTERKEGTFTFKYTVSDKAGNKAEAERTLTVSDSGAPVITLNGGDVINLLEGETWNDPGAVATDDFEGEVEVVSSGAPNTAAAGNYTVTYSASDSKGHSSTASRTVVVMQKPVPVPGGVPSGGVVSGSTIYLTFDDGPSYMTPRILDILAQYNVKATFFILNYSEANKALVARAINEGHTIGIHGYSHDYSIIYTSPQAGLDNITKLHDKLIADFGYSTNLTRFPGGSSNTISRNYCLGVMSALCPLAEQYGYHYFDWNVSSQDAAGGYVSAATIISNVTNYLRTGRGNVVLMHDSYGKETTAEALPYIIDYGIANGYTFAGLSSDTPPVHHPINN